jgi:hypothetical protein
MFSPCVGDVLMKMYPEICHCPSDLHELSSMGTIYVVLQIQNQFINHLRQFVQFLLGHPTQRITIFHAGLYGCEISPLFLMWGLKKLKKRVAEGNRTEQQDDLHSSTGSLGWHNQRWSLRPDLWHVWERNEIIGPIVQLLQLWELKVNWIQGVKLGAHCYLAQGAVFKHCKCATCGHPYGGGGGNNNLHGYTFNYCRFVWGGDLEVTWNIAII